MDCARSKKVPAAIHLSPEALGGGPIQAVQDGDRIRLDGHQGTLEVLTEDFSARLQQPLPPLDVAASSFGVGRELFAGFRQLAGPADQGAISIGWE